MGQLQKEKAFTYEVNSFIKPATDVSFVVVFHRDAFVLIVPFEMVRAVCRDIDQGGDPQSIQHVFSGSMIGTA